MPYSSAEQARTCGTLLNQYDPHLLDRFKYEMSYGVDRFFLLSYCLACCWPGFSAVSNLRVVRQWSELEFNFPSPLAEQVARDNRYYVPGNSVPIDVDVHHRNGGLPSRIFVTIPRFDEGRPMTLGTVDPQGRISAYPDYTWHDNQGRNCDGLTSVFRVAIDECNRLWVMDAGKIGDIQVCPPQLLAFNLHNDQLIFRHVVNASSYIATSLFITPIFTSSLDCDTNRINSGDCAEHDVTSRLQRKVNAGCFSQLGPVCDRKHLIVVDVRGQGPGDCANTFVYVADVSGFGLLVVDVTNHRSWRLTHRLFFPYPSHGTFTIDGESFDLMDGVLGMALSPPHGTDRYLYFHALASTTENILNTRALRNDSHIEDPNLPPHLVYEFKEERPNQAAAEAIDRDGVMYFGLMEPPSIWCWNTATEFAQRNFHQLAIDREALQFASGVKVVNNLKGEQELWVLTSSFQRVMTGSLSSDKINYRIHAEKISTLLANSPCKKPSKMPRPGYFTNFHAQTDRGHHVHFRYGAVSSL